MKNNLFTKSTHDNDCKNKNQNFFSNIINYSLNKSFSCEDNKEKKLDINSNFRMKCI